MGTPRSSCSARRKVASGGLRLGTSFHPGWRRGGRVGQGFTLVELLVVIGIIGILAAMVLPGLSKAKEQGRNAACKSNLHQIEVAVALYLTDHNGRFPYPFPNKEVPGLKAQPQTPSAGSGTQISAWTFTWADSLYPYDPVRWTNAGFNCPTYMANHGVLDIGDQTYLNISSGAEIYFPTLSYAWNGFGVYNGPDVVTGNGTIEQGLQNATDRQIVAPSEFYMIADARSATMPGMVSAAPGGPNYSSLANGRWGWSYFSFYNTALTFKTGHDGFAYTGTPVEYPPEHGGETAYNVLCADGHVAQVAQRSFLYLPISASPWNKNNQPNPDNWDSRSLWQIQQ